jgi:hypothetical protein
MKIFRIINMGLMYVLLLTGIVALVAAMLGYTHLWIIVIMCCVLYFSLWYDSDVMKCEDKNDGNDTRRK